MAYAGAADESQGKLPESPAACITAQDGSSDEQLARADAAHITVACVAVVVDGRYVVMVSPAELHVSS